MVDINFNYGDVLKHTKEILEIRSKFFKYTILILSILVLANIVASIWLGTFKPFAAFFLVFPIYAVFIYFDQRHVFLWKETLLTAWQNDDIDIGVSVDVIESVPHFPKATINSMIATLPTESGVDELSKSQRNTLLTQQRYLHQLQRVFYLGSVMRSLLGVVLVFLSINFGTFLFLIGFFILFVYKQLELRVLKNKWSKSLGEATQDTSIYAMVQSLEQTPFVL